MDFRRQDVPAENHAGGGGGGAASPAAAITRVAAASSPLMTRVASGPDAGTTRVSPSSGGVTVNGVFSHYLENNLPFGGVNTSGTGSYHGYFGFKCFSHERAVYRHR